MITQKKLNQWVGEWLQGGNRAKLASQLHLLHKHGQRKQARKLVSHLYWVGVYPHKG